MASDFGKKFSDPRWEAKKRQVLEKAGYECEFCQIDERLEVHICFFEPGVEPWDYPDEAYKCYCSEDRLMRRGLESDIRRVMAAFGPNELDSLHSALSQIAGHSESDRALAMERFYVAAKKVGLEELE